MEKINLIIKNFFKLFVKPFLHVCFKFWPELKSINNYRYSFGRMPNLICHKTFNEKILLKILFERNPKLTLFADKFMVRDFVESRLGDNKYLTKLYAVVDNPAEIRKLNLPNQFVMKASHTSGDIKIINDFNKVGYEELEKLASLWLQKNQYKIYNEWAYRSIKPRIIFEEFLECGGKIPDDYKFFCFNGEPSFIQIDKNRFINHKRNIYDLNFSLLPVKYVYDNFQDKITPPKDFEKMLEIARKLSSETNFIRVDLYNINGRVIFGELTNYPEAGIGKFEPSDWDLKFGNYWKNIKF